MKCSIDSGIKADITIVSSLEKIFPDKHDYPDMDQLEVFRGERSHFQAVIRTPDPFAIAELEISGPLARYSTVHELIYTPCMLPAAAADPDTLRTASGLFPGVLMPGSRSMELHVNCSNAFWITLDIPEKCPAGTFDVELDFKFNPYRGESRNTKLSLPVKIFDSVIQPQKLACEMWFHGDGILNYYKVRCWSKRCWEIFEEYFRDMAKHGVDTLLTPLWTPPLDTARNKSRPTVQLLDISKSGTEYTFSFRRLKKWIDTARKAGIRKFSFSHIFTQWGLSSTPKIVVREDGKEKELFGWHTAADSPEYESFLRQLFAKLIPFLHRNGLTEKDVYFHLSDEPSEAHLEQYRKCSLLVHSMIPGFRTLDAMSHACFLDEGLVECPVVNESRLEDFLDRTPVERWIYYCGEWENNVPNRKLGMSSARNRIMGVLLYLYRMDGFLEWGYNFWFSQESIHQDLDPWSFRDIHRIFGNNGGAFAVLPGKDGKPVPTVHFEVFTDALQDLRLLQQLEVVAGRAEVEKLLNEGLSRPITLHEWPDDPAWFHALRKKIGALLTKQTAPKKSKKKM